MSKRFQKFQCAYCSSRQAVTGDHIFAREFFLSAARANLPQAPTCAECNNAKSKLEHYLTAVLPFGGRHGDAVENLASMVPKRLQKNARLHRELSGGRSYMLLPDLLGMPVRSMVVPIDGKQLEALFAMAARGLIWFYWRLYLNEEYAVETSTLTRIGEQFYDQALFKLNGRNRVRGNIGGGTFIYEGIQAMDDPCLTVWRFAIYGGLAFCGDEDVPSESASTILVITTRKTIRTSRS